MTDCIFVEHTMLWPAAPRPEHAVKARRIIATPPPRAKKIMEETAQDHNTSVRAMMSPLRLKKLAHARFDAFTRLRNVVNEDGGPVYSLPHIGHMFGGRDHTTVLSGIRRWAALKAAEEQSKPVDGSIDESAT